MNEKSTLRFRNLPLIPDTFTPNQELFTQRNRPKKKNLFNPSCNCGHCNQSRYDLCDCRLCNTNPCYDKPCRTKHLSFPHSNIMRCQYMSQLKEQQNNTRLVELKSTPQPEQPPNFPNDKYIIC